MSGKYKIEEITSPGQIKEFLGFQVKLYQGDKNYIRPLNKDVEKIFDPDQNKLLRKGEIIRWLLRNEKEEVVGRVAAFIDYRKLRTGKVKAGGMGFFDCIDKQEAADVLFDACKMWLREKGAEAMDGPVNFGDRNEWWGCLSDGFYEPAYCMPYNYPYYNDLFQNYGFKLFFRQYTYWKKMTEEGINEVLYEKAERIDKNPDYTFEHVKKNKLDKYAADYVTIFNKAWAKFPGVSRVSLAHARLLMKKIKPILDGRIMWFAYYKGEPVGIYLMVPEINQIVKHLNGKLNLWGKAMFLYHKWKGTINKAHGALFGIVPEHQGKGLEGAIAIAFARLAKRKKLPYKEMELNWIGDFNPSMMRFVEEQVGATIYKTHITYRYLFDRDAPYERAASV